MRGRERERARRISAYVDALVVQQRTREDSGHVRTADDREFAELAGLAAVLSRIKMVAPRDWAEDLREQLPRLAAARESEERAAALRSSVAAALRSAARRLWHVPVLRTVAATALLVAVTVFVISELSLTRTVSADQILTRADAALGAMVRPGSVLYRRWRVVDVRRVANSPGKVQERFIDEWLDGSDLHHVAGRWMAPSGELLTAYVNVRDNGEYRGRVYFAPTAHEARGLLSVEPTRREFQEAVARFPDAERQKLQEYLARGYIYEPVVGERRFNRAVVEHTGEALILPWARLSLDDSGELSGIPVFKVRVVDPVRVRFRWTAAGSPVVWLERQETTRYISRDTYLTVKTVDDRWYETGERVLTTRELIETRISAAEVVGQAPFELDVPAATPVRLQSAFEQLSAVAAALNRVPLNQ